jgi:crotonobetainyl-CoA:carnitine CoA-transferase CaiB-like acyl-CoA transferase
VIDNFRPGVLERLRIDYTTLSELNPRIVACSITGFGSASPRRSMPSFDLIHQAMSGMLSVTGSRDGPPARLGIPLADLAAPMFALHGILAALIAAERTGRGRRIEVSMLEALTFLHTYDGLITLNGGQTPHAWGTEHAHLVPWQAFATQDGHVAIAPREERLWRSLCIALQLPHLADDPRFATNADRVANRDLLIPILARQIGQRTTAEWLQAMAAHEVPAAPVNDLEQALAEATLAGEDAIVEVDLPSFGRLRMLANPVRVAGTAAGYLPPPQLGEDTDAVLREVVGARQARATADVGRTGARLAGDRR